MSDTPSQHAATVLANRIARDNAHEKCRLGLYRCRPKVNPTWQVVVASDDSYQCARAYVSNLLISEHPRISDYELERLGDVYADDGKVVVYNEPIKISLMESITHE